MKIQISDVQRIGENQKLWSASIERDLLLRLGKPLQMKGKTTLISSEDIHYDAENSTLSTEFSTIRILNLGTSSNSIIIDLGNEKPEHLYNEYTEIGFLRDFIISSRECNISSPLRNSMHAILKRISNSFDFYLTEGEARKWTSTPNFVAITIQNRNQAYRISVFDIEYKDLKSIDIVPGRTPYLEFKFTETEQEEDVFKAILRSAQKV